MDFLDISSLGTAYRYAVKIEQNLSTRTSGSLGLQICNNQSMVNTTLTTNLQKTVQATGKEGSKKDEEGHWKMVRFPQNPLAQHR
jgi:hypothetical protein